ncbi:MAG: hypothetical protein QM803_19485 [Rhodocyclaceae bacterium]
MSYRFARRFAAATLAVLHLGAAVAQTCSSSSSSSGSNGLGSVFSVFAGGSITFGNNDSNGQCNVAFLGGNQLNVTSSNLAMPGTVANGKTCQNYSTTPTTAMQATGTTPERRTLTPFPTFSASTNSTTESTTTVNLAKGDYNTVLLRNADGAVVNLVDGTRIKTLQIYKGTVVFAPGTYYIESIDTQAGFNIKVSGSVGVVTLNVKNGLTLNGGVSCVNMTTCSKPTSVKEASTLGAAQSPERLQINIYTGNFTPQNNISIAAGIYVDQGIADLANGSTFVVGEILASSVKVQNNSNTYYYSKASSMGGNSGTTTEDPTNGYYNLAPPAVPPRASVGDYAFFAVQRDVTASGTAGTSGHLFAYGEQADGSLAGTAAWDAATVMTATDRSNRIQTVGSTGALVKLKDVDAAAFGASSGKFTTLIATIFDPNYGGGAMLAGRDPASLVGRPWRTAPIIVGDAVLFAADDGILYSVDRKTGTLKWGWIPRELLPQTADPKAMADAHPWGQINVVISGGVTYITGTAMQGALHMSLKLDGDGDLVSVAWNDYVAAATSPSYTYGTFGGAAPSGPVRETSTVARVAYIRNNQLIIRNVDSSGATSASTATLPTTATSNLLYIDNLTIYYGDSNGNVQVVNSAGSQGSSPGNMGQSPAQPIISLNAGWHKSDSGTFLIVLGHTMSRITGFQQSASGWARAWYVGVQESSATGIEALPAGSVITASPTFGDEKVTFPYTITTSCGQDGYVYGPIGLDDGLPRLSGVTFRGASVGSAVTHYLGRGEAVRISLGVVGARSFAFGYANGGKSNASPNTGWGQIEDTQANPPGRVNWRELTNYY